MSDLTEILKMQWEAYPNALKTGQDAQANAIALDNARRAQQEREGIKALFANQTAPSYQQLGAFDPAMAQEYLKNQYSMQKDMIGMQHQQAETAKILNAEDREKEALMSNAALPYLNAYEANIGKIPDAENHHRLMTGLSGIANQAVAEGWAPSHYKSMDPNATYESIVSNANKSKVYTDSQRLQQEASKSQGSQEGLVRGGVAPQPSTYYNSYGHDGKGNVFVIPGSSGMWPPGAKNPENTQPPDANATPADPANIKKLTFYENMLKAPDATAEEQAFAEDQIRKLSPKENFKVQPQVVINTPEQMGVKEAEQKANVAGAEKEAVLAAEEQQNINKSLKAYETLPDINHIRNLVKGAIGGDIEYWANRLGRTVGESLKAGDIQAALAVVASDMASSVAFAPGSQSDKELAQKLKQVGNLDANMTKDEKMSAVEEWFQGRQRYIEKYGKYSDDELIALGREGKITHETALKVRANRNKGQ